MPFRKLDAEGQALAADAVEHGFESAEQLYRSLAALRDGLSDQAKTQLAVVFEWALEGLDDEGAPELQALRASYIYARDTLLGSLKKE